MKNNDSYKDPVRVDKQMDPRQKTFAQRWIKKKITKTKT